MSNIIILSIHKQHADNILSGKKIYEFRKNKPKKQNLPYLVLLYETQNGGGAGAIVGACKMSNTITFTACELETPVMGVWRKALADGACLTIEELKQYATAIQRSRHYGYRYVSCQRALAALKTRAHPCAYELALFIIV